MADTTIEFEIQYLKGEIKSMHSVGMLVPSRMYERLHRLEKKRAREKRDLVADMHISPITLCLDKTDFHYEKGWNACLEEIEK